MILVSTTLMITYVSFICYEHTAGPLEGLGTATWLTTVDEQVRLNLLAYTSWFRLFHFSSAAEARSLISVSIYEYIFTKDQSKSYSTPECRRPRGEARRRAVSVSGAGRYRGTMNRPVPPLEMFCGFGVRFASDEDSPILFSIHHTFGPDFLHRRCLYSTTSNPRILATHY